MDPARCESLDNFHEALIWIQDLVLARSILLVGLLLLGSGALVDVLTLDGLVLARPNLWATAWAASASQVAEASGLETHWLAHVHALGAALERAQTRLADVTAELAGAAIHHALGVAVQAWLALVPAVQAALDATAGLAALEWAWVWIAAKPEAPALVAARQGAWAVSEVALEARAPGPAARWRATITAPGAAGSETTARRSKMAHTHGPRGDGGVDAAWKDVIPWLVVEVLLGSAFDGGGGFGLVAVIAVASHVVWWCGPVLCVDTCLLYTSDAADEEDSVDLGGRRIIKKKKKKKRKGRR
eukprot:TRINITY_DN3000_c0_g1_i2.p1 TRINITY_DN3000_c0_g1~~TRINITY_DN3000_c0_g1_i2.p1  ORF type:complete len:302 (+),score=51.76 TRINITY_DN3000_c0_g1_i2:361-1266(+)